jgi:hypothetical protein
LRGAKTLRLEKGFRRIKESKWAERSRLKEKEMGNERWRRIK